MMSGSDAFLDGEVQIQQSNLTNDEVQVLIISGRSGSGKTSVLNVLEDLGFHAIDNMPLSLVPDAVTTLIADGGIKRLALGIDIRTLQADSSSFYKVQHQLISTYGEDRVNVLYVTAQESVLVARFAATRRVHPLMSQGTDTTHNLPNAIKKEAEALEPISSNADFVIDTSQLNIHELKERVREYIGADNQVKVNILSFGFKYGVPIDADFVFDVRILPNPHWNTELRAKTGKDSDVIEFFKEYPEVSEMQDDIQRFLNRWLPEFLNNNRHTVTIAIGCTGGKHRSVFISETLQSTLSDRLPSNMLVAVKHREKSRWNNT